MARTNLTAAYLSTLPVTPNNKDQLATKLAEHDSALDALEGTSALISTAVNCTELSIPGLNGDTDGRYFLDGVIHMPINAAPYYSFRPNGVTTNMGSAVWIDEGSYSVFGYLAMNVGLTSDVRVFGAPIMMRFRAWIDGQRTIGGVSVWRSFQSRAVVTHGDVSHAYQYAYEGSGAWRETSTNITSLSLVSSTTDGILAGSQVRIYKVTGFGA